MVAPPVHTYDDTGVCAGCDRCDDADCCPPVEGCDLRRWAGIWRERNPEVAIAPPTPRELGTDV